MARGAAGSQPPMSGRNNRTQQISTNFGGPAGGAAATSQEEEGINRILNNINVQTRKAGD